MTRRGSSTKLATPTLDPLAARGIRVAAEVARDAGITGLAVDSALAMADSWTPLADAHGAESALWSAIEVSPLRDDFLRLYLERFDPLLVGPEIVAGLFAGDMSAVADELHALGDRLSTVLRFDVTFDAPSATTHVELRAVPELTATTSVFDVVLVLAARSAVRFSALGPFDVCAYRPFERRPIHDELSRLYGIAIEHDASHAYVALRSTNAHSEPLPHDSVLRAVVESLSRGRPEPAADAVSAVRAAILTAIATGTPTLQSVSDQLALGSEHVAHSIHAAGLTFDRLLDDVRRERALQLVGTPGLKLDALARATGFSSASAFARAFRRWTGTTTRRMGAHATRDRG